MKKTVKIMGIIIMSMLLVFCMTNICKADDVLDPATLANDLHATNTAARGQVTTIGNQIIGIITTVGVVVAVIILLVLGIKYMMGSASEKAEYKKTMIPYIVGAVLIFGASAITKVVVGLASGLG